METKKLCCVCKKEQPRTYFRKQKKSRDGLNPMCRPCINAYQREWRKKNLHRTKIYARKGLLRRNYSMTIDEHDQKLAMQGGVCAICNAPEPGENNSYFHTDHNHTTGQIRGLLCGKCNRGLGYFNDNAKLLSAAAEYLLLHEHLKENHDPTK